jgi:hypothetical protein
VLFLEAWILPCLFFFGLWWILPVEDDSWWGTATGIALLLGTVILLYRTGPIWPSIGKRYFFSKKDSQMDALLVLSPLVVGFALAGKFELQMDATQTIKSLLIYPLYALLQLSIFLAIPASRMNKIGQSALRTCLVCAAVFGLAHFPNMLLLAFTGLAMLVLCYQFLNGRSLLALALVMGMAATGFKLAVPPEWSWEMRIGWDYTIKRMEHSQQEK